MKKKKIYEVFNTATDAYLEYVNNFITKERFTEFFDLEEAEVDELFSAANDVKKKKGLYTEIEYFFNKRINKNYSEQNIHW